MKAGAGNAKGSAFERKCCKALSLWISNGARDDIFWPSALSGGRATVQLKSGKVNRMQSGDVCAVDPLGYPFVEQYFVEIKHYRELSIARGFVCETGTLYKFWQVAKTEAAKYGKHPLLIARQNRYPTLAITEVGAGIFREEPMLTLHRWGAVVYLFDEATRVRVQRVRRARRGE